MVKTLKPYVEAEWGWDEPDQRRRFAANLSPTELRIIVHEGCDVGVLHVQRLEDRICLSNIAILPSHQNQGLGSAVIRDVIASAHDLVAGVQLQVLMVNPARNLYARLEFEQYGETATHAQMHWRHSPSSP